MAEEDTNSLDTLTLEGIIKGSADEKGRIKVPGAIRKYLQQSDETVFFITTFDVRTIRVYTRESWKHNAALLDQSTRKAAAHILFIAKVHGGSATLDSQNRMLLPATLRQKLGIGSEKVWFEQSKDHVEVYSAKVLEERLVGAMADLPDKIHEVEELGVR